MLCIAWCIDWRPSQHWMFQMANVLFFVSYSVPTSYYGIVFMHSTLIAGIPDLIDSKTGVCWFLWSCLSNDYLNDILYIVDLFSSMYLAYYEWTKLIDELAVSIINITWRSILVLGFLILITWAWKIVCAPDVFTWNLCFLLINILQLIYLIYQRRPINFNSELEQVYRNMFKPFKVRR